MHNFLYRPTNEIFTPLALKMRGVDPNNIPGVRVAGYALVTYDYPKFDSRTHYMEPKTQLTPNGEDFIQEFLVKPLPNDLLAQSLERAKEDKLQSVNANCDDKLKNLVSTYPDMEIASFDKQESEARAILAGKEPETSLLKSLAVNRGIDLQELCRRVVAKADEFALASGIVFGQRQRMEDAIKAANTFSELEKVDVNYNLHWEQSNV